MTNPNDPAFGSTTVPKDIEIKKEMKVFGLTKREYFAAMAMTGISVWDAEINEPIHTGKIEELARGCVAYADALIAELDKESNGGEGRNE